MNQHVKRVSLTHDEVYTKICLESQAGAYVSYLRGEHCKTEDDFLIEVGVSFQFPFYYGENWPAFDECINDLEWINFTRIFVIFDDFSMAFRDQPSIQNMLQERVIRYWNNSIEEWAAQGKKVEVWINN